MMLAVGIGKKNDLLDSVNMKDMVKIDDILAPTLTRKRSSVSNAQMYCSTFERLKGIIK